MGPTLHRQHRWGASAYSKWVSNVCLQQAEIKHLLYTASMHDLLLYTASRYETPILSACTEHFLYTVCIVHPLYT